MKLDVNVLRYLQKDEFRTLTAVEMGQKNHELVPTSLIDTIAGLKHGGARKCLSLLLRHKLVHHESKKYDGFRLTYLGYDFLAIKTLVNRGVIASVGRKIGVGKESDVYEVADDEGQIFCLKLHRLGRTSFRAVKSKRDYLSKGSHYSWLYLSRLAALKEFAFMKALGERGLPVPQAIEANRHAVLMTLVDAVPLVQVKQLAHPRQVYQDLMSMMERLARLGLVHCDFNEFNILIGEDESLTLIDFPQMVSSKHRNARELFDRDVDCVIRFFSKKLGYVPSLDEGLERVRPDFAVADSADDGVLDKTLRASGFKSEHERVLLEAQEEEREREDEGEEVSGEESEKEKEEEEEEEEEESASGSEGGSSSSDEVAGEGIGDGEAGKGAGGRDAAAAHAEGSRVSASSSSDEEPSSEEDQVPMTRAERRAAAEARNATARAARRAEAEARCSASASAAAERLETLSMATDADPKARSMAAQQVLSAQHKRAARRAAITSASRNAMKSRNAGRRKGDSGPSVGDW